MDTISRTPYTSSLSLITSTRNSSTRKDSSNLTPGLVTLDHLARQLLPPKSSTRQASSIMEEQPGQTAFPENFINTVALAYTPLWRICSMKSSNTMNPSLPYVQGCLSHSTNPTQSLRHRPTHALSRYSTPCEKSCPTSSLHASRLRSKSIYLSTKVVSDRAAAHQIYYGRTAF